MSLFGYNISDIIISLTALISHLNCPSVLGHLTVLPGSTHRIASLVILLPGIKSIPTIILMSLDRLHVVLHPRSLGQVLPSEDGLITRT